MATKAPSGRSGVNNYGAQSPVKNIGTPQHGVGGSIKTTHIKAAATHAGHRQVNPGSGVKGNPNATGGGAGYQAATKHAANATMVGKKEASNSK
ncbi:type IV secretory pathway TrbL component [Oxalobacteraceae bacterium GrIS 2.11]